MAASHLSPRRTATASGVVPLSEGPNGGIGICGHEKHLFRLRRSVLTLAREEPFLCPRLPTYGKGSKTP